MGKNYLIVAIIIALSSTVYLVFSPLNTFSLKESNINNIDFPNDVSNIVITS